MQRKNREGIDWLEYEIFHSCKLKHASFLRHGGVSQGQLSSLNFGNVLGEREENVKKNTSLAQQLLEIPLLYASKQCHGKEVAEITHAFLAKKECVTADALMTNEKGIGLMIKHADCQAAIFYDPCQQAVAVVHAGWRGSVQNIYRATIEKMKGKYRSQPQDLLVSISHSLGPTHAEFKNYEHELPRTFWEHQVKPLYFDFWEISRRQLIECGILSHHIEIAGICTYENIVDCFSHRRDPTTGRHATIVGL